MLCEYEKEQLPRGEYEISRVKVKSLRKRCNLLERERNRTSANVGGGGSSSGSNSSMTSSGGGGSESLLKSMLQQGKKSASSSVLKFENGFQS